MPTYVQFKQHLREALIALYDPAVLNNSPLSAWLGLAEEANKSAALRSALTRAIETFKPGNNDPAQAKSWRMYQVLSQRYTGQWTQRKVANNLGLSERQLQREEKTAFETLADFLWSQRLQGGTTQPSADPTKRGPAEDQQESFQSYTSGLQPQWIELAPILRDTIRTLTSVADRAGVDIRVNLPKGRSFILTPVSLFRQGVLNVLNQAVQLAPHGRVTITTVQRPTEKVIHCDLQVPPAQGARPESDLAHIFAPARELIEACGGTLHVEPVKGESEPGGQAVGHATVSIVIPDMGQVPVLFVDDNADTLRLYQYYLAGSPYQFLGAATGRQGLTLAKEARPRVIVIDVMIPDQDGWQVLEQLRIHPKTQDIPVIICSILPQQDLALALGAVHFLQKPIKQSDLLDTLTLLIHPMAKELD